jgi:hypothetical protein
LTTGERLGMRRFLTQTADTVATWTSHQRAAGKGAAADEAGDADVAFGVKLLALIRGVFLGPQGQQSQPQSCGGVGAGSPGAAALHSRRQRRLQRAMAAEDEDEGGATIDVAEGWVFAYEGGAHILFRHVLQNPRFVLPPSLSHASSSSQQRAFHLISIVELTRQGWKTLETGQAE